MYIHRCIFMPIITIMEILDTHHYVALCVVGGQLQHIHAHIYINILKQYIGIIHAYTYINKQTKYTYKNYNGNRRCSPPHGAAGNRPSAFKRTRTYIY